MNRNLDDLRPEFGERVRVMLGRAAEEHFDLLVTCTLRTPAEQAELYRVGRNLTMVTQKAEELSSLGRHDLADLLLQATTPPGFRIVTKAGPGQSAHNYGLAVDCVPMIAGKPVWDSKHPAWQTYGRLVREAGMVWAGDWRRFREYPHAQAPGFNWREMIV